MEERILEKEKINWMRAPADTPVCAEKEIFLSDVIQAILDGFETPEEIMEELSLTAEDSGSEEIPAILDIFVPVINAWRSGAGCGGSCESCGGCC